MLLSRRCSHHRPSSRPLHMALWLLIPVGFAVVLWQTAQVAREAALDSLRQDAEDELRLSAAGLTGHLSRHEYLPELLATREIVKRYLSGPPRQDMMPLNLLLDRFRYTADVSDIYLLDREGTTVAASNWHRPDTFLGENYRFRPYYQEAIAGRQGRFHGLGVISDNRGYYFSSPVWLDDLNPDASPVGVMTVKVLIDGIESSWQNPDTELLIVDQNGVVFMSSHAGLRLRTLAPISDQRREQLRSSRRYADEPLHATSIQQIEHFDEDSQLVTFIDGPLQGRNYLRLVRGLPQLGWQMHILKPLGPVTEAQWLAMTLSGGLYGILVLGVGIGWQRHRLHREREKFADRERTTLAQARDELERNVACRTQDLVAEIEERRRTEAKLRQTRDELVQAAKLAVLGQLAAGINHELNQPLAAIRAYAENARAFIARQQWQTVDANLEQIVELTCRMADISAQLRQFSRKSGDQPSAVSVSDCFDYALRLFQARINQDAVEIRHQVGDEKLWVMADLVRLEQVLVNLISNALQAMGDTEAPCLTLGSCRADGQVRIWLDDNGPGIPDDQRQHIFEPFYTTRAPGSGLGLGLSISARIIDDFGGRLSVDPSPSGGARFIIVLPEAPEANRRPASSQPSTAS